MKILYAGHGIIGAVGLCHLFSSSKINIDNITLLIDNSKSSLMKIYAENYNLRFYQIECKNIYEEKFDLLISAHWRQRIEKDILDLCRLGGVNLHPSLLPKYAGCSSLAWAILNKEKEVGFSWHLMEDDFDVGDIIIQKKIPIYDEDTAFSLWNRVNILGIKEINKLISLADGGFKERIKQDLSKRTYYSRGFPTFESLLKENPNLPINLYERASFFPKFN